MANGALVDNDVALKISCYSLVDEFLNSITSFNLTPTMLGVSKFVIHNRLTRRSKVRDKSRALNAFEKLLESVELVEPSEQELALAADLEAEANRHDLDLDGGESQLVAILTNRAYRFLLTGDKRAIVAIASIAPHLTGRRIACLEQLIGHIVDHIGGTYVRNAVCAEPDMDQALAICFSCRGDDYIDENSIVSSLLSYINHINQYAPSVLLSGHNFSDIEVNADRVRIPHKGPGA